MGDKKTSTNSTNDAATHLVNTPTNPGYVDNGLQTLATGVTNLAGQDPSNFYAGADPLQTQAAGAAGGLSVSPDFASASTALGGVGPNAVQAHSLLANLPAYMSPYTNDVVNTSLADYDQGAGYTRAQNTLARANDDTFGGSGGAIQTALSNDAIDRGRGTLAAGLRDQGFQVGAGLANQDADRAQQAQQASAGDAIAAGQGLTNNGTASGAAATSNINLQAGLGAVLQQLAQNKASNPLAVQGALNSMYAGLPLGLVHGQTADGTDHSTGSSTTTVSDPMGQFGSLLSGAGSLATGLGSMGLMFSDRRLKRDAIPVGSAGGHRWWLFRYLNDAAWRFGVMAQEVLAVKPEAVVSHPSGYLMVDYGKL